MKSLNALGFRTALDAKLVTILRFMRRETEAIASKQFQALCQKTLRSLHPLLREANAKLCPNAATSEVADPPTSLETLNRVNLELQLRDKCRLPRHLETVGWSGCARVVSYTRGPAEIQNRVNPTSTTIYEQHECV